MNVPGQAEVEALVWHEAGADGAVVRIIAPGAMLGWPHSFTLDRLTNVHERTRMAVPEVVFVQSGTAQVSWDGGALTLGPGDTMTIPVGLERKLSGDAVIYRVLGVN